MVNSLQGFGWHKPGRNAKQEFLAEQYPSWVKDPRSRYLSGWDRLPRDVRKDSWQCKEHLMWCHVNALTQPSICQGTYSIQHTTRHMGQYKDREDTNNAHTFTADVKVKSFQLLKHFKELHQESGNLCSELIVVCNIRCSLWKPGLWHDDAEVVRGVISISLTPTGCSTHRTLARRVQLHSFLCSKLSVLSKLSIVAYILRGLSLSPGPC